MLRILDRQRDTELNFLEAYLGYRRSLLRLMVNTQYDYEKDSSLLDLFSAQYENGDSSNEHFTQNINYKSAPFHGGF